MKYAYFVSWFYSDKKHTSVSNGEVLRYKKIESIEEIKEIAQEIADKAKYLHPPTILTFTLLRECEDA